MAFSDHRKVEITKGDLVIVSASPIPGNEKAISTVINELFKKGADVVYKSLENIHVSGHACQEELKLILSLVKPKYFIPVHGEFRHLKQHAALAEKMGMKPKNIILGDIGKTIELTPTTCKLGGSVTSGAVLIDGLGVGDVGNIVLRDRKHLAEDGIIIVVVTVSKIDGSVLSGPDVISRGFVYVRESVDLMDEAKTVAQKALEKCAASKKKDWASLKAGMKSSMSDFVYVKTKRKPMILPIIMEV